METTTIINVFIFIAFGLLIVVTGGVIYLTTIDWRDRRRQDREQKQKR